MINTKLKPFSHKIGSNFWHLEWCTKYRYKMMQKLENKRKSCASAIRKAANEYKIKIHILSVMPDHVHLLVTFPHGMTDSSIQPAKRQVNLPDFQEQRKARLRYPQGHFWAGRRMRGNSRI